MRIDMGNPYNAQRHRVMWSLLQNHEEPIIGALEMDAACVVVNLFMLPDEPELFRQCVENISKVRADCHQYGMPLMIEPLVMLPNEMRGGYQVDGNAEKIVTLVRLASEMGADIIKADPTDDPEEFHRVVEAARVPVLVRGGGKEDLKAVLAKSATLMKEGARGMVYGRNIYQHANPNAVVSALMAMIHQRAGGEEAWDIYNVADSGPICSDSMPAIRSSRRSCSTRTAGSCRCMPWTVPHTSRPPAWSSGRCRSFGRTPRRPSQAASERPTSTPAPSPLSDGRPWQWPLPSGSGRRGSYRRAIARQAGSRAGRGAGHGGRL